MKAREEERRQVRAFESSFSGLSGSRALIMAMEGRERQLSDYCPPHEPRLMLMGSSSKEREEEEEGGGGEGGGGGGGERGQGKGGLSTERERRRRDLQRAYRRYGSTFGSRGAQMER